MKKLFVAAALAVVVVTAAHAEIATRFWLTQAQYQQTFDEMVAGGFRPTHVDGYATPAGTLYAAIWLKSASTRPWIARHALSTTQFQQEFNKNAALGFRLRDVSATDGGVFAGIWEKGDGPAWFAFAGLNLKALGEQFAEKSKAGFRVADIEGYTEGGETKFAVIWVKNTDNRGWYMFGEMDAAAYQTKVNEMLAKGFRAVHVDGYGTPSGGKFAAVFEKISNTFVTRHNMTAQKAKEEYDVHTANGFTLTDVSGYTHGNTVLYAAIWEK